MDVLFLKDFKLETIIGLYEWERKAPQPILIDLEIGLSWRLRMKSPFLRGAAFRCPCSNSPFE